VKNKILEISITISLAGFNSRPEVKTEEYFCSLNFSDFVRNPHKNLTFGSQNAIHPAYQALSFSILYFFLYVNDPDQP